MFKDPLSDPGGDLRDSLLELGSHSLTLERLDGVRVCRSGHDDEGHNGRL